MRLARLGHEEVRFRREKWSLRRVHEMGELQAPRFRALRKPCTEGSKDSFKSDREARSLCCRGAIGCQTGGNNRDDSGSDVEIAAC